ncbi:hypothetical protein LMG29542_07227 [Paraburkholderia humisilvae]|uniref:Uncharacterized protein n=1 Tax=Paraburkholderia humisilvae TaxID=627669 RepID=A0A6J5F3H4_9BURK|nr:hypothetical protein LMG29542_07227 [Paraburkholderia humisilvae]
MYVREPHVFPGIPGREFGITVSAIILVNTEVTRKESGYPQPLKEAKGGSIPETPVKPEVVERSRRKHHPAFRGSTPAIWRQLTCILHRTTRA